jgi:hypothetical protein
MDQPGQQSTFISKWRKSSYSGTPHGNCVEIVVVADRVLLRDSKNVAGPTLAFGDLDWRAFLADLD